MPQTTDIKKLETIAQRVRVSIIEMLTAAKSGHPGGSLSSVELLTALWFSEMKGTPDLAGKNTERDRFVLSKGHGVPTLYALFAELGLISKDELLTLRRTGARLQGHPDRVRIPLVEASTGSLGQGLSVAQGLALGFKMDKKPHRVFCLLGDGEIQEGQIWEAAMSAPKFKLDNLCVILDHNGGQIDGPVSEVMPIEPIVDKWRAFGWNVMDIDGHNLSEILAAYSEARKMQTTSLGRPTFIRARTVKGKGVSFMENNIGWHGVVPKADEAIRAIAEITQGRK
jgi:transketolase